MTTITTPPNSTNHVIAWARTLQLDLGSQIQKQKDILELLTTGVNDVADRIQALREAGHLSPEQEKKVNEIEAQNNTDKANIESSAIYIAVNNAENNLQELANL